MKVIRKNIYVFIFGFAAFLLLGAFVDSKYILDIFITTLYYTAIAGAWNIMCGYAGSLSLGHVAFMGVGQYATVLLYTKIGLSPWLGMIVGMGVSMLLALFVGLLALRLKGFYFSLSTIAVTTILQIFALRWTGLTGGAVGITIPFNAKFSNMIFKSYVPTYLLFVMLVTLILLTTAYLSRSKLGSNLIAIREDDIAAASLGINTYKSRVYALLISAAFTSLAGSIYTMYTMFIDPYGSFNTVISQKAAILSIIGGSGTVFGPLIGGLILSPIEIFLRTWLGSTYQGAYLIIYGVILVVVIFTLPNGIVGAFRGYMDKSKKGGKKDYAAEPR